MVSRPNDLPDFAQPPLNEVVLGVQFDPPQGYQQIYAGDVWDLFKSDFPIVQELPAIPPSFETFGTMPGAQFNFGIMAGATHDRFWFLSKNGSELIQFQNDRLLHNWRKVGDESNEYPRFEGIIAKFMDELERLEAFMSRIRSQKLIIRQCELTYINHIRPGGEAINPSEWLRFVSPDMTPPDDFSASFRRVIEVKGQPRGRLICESSTAIDEAARRFIALTLTARGAPDTPKLESALEFLSKGRDMIVRLFTEITTDSAQRTWERTQ